MDCPNCKIPLNQEYRCLTCDFDVNDAPWVIIKKVYAPNELIIKSVLESYGIPVKIASKEVAQMPFPLALWPKLKLPAGK
jgi:hypothetical protein